LISIMKSNSLSIINACIFYRSVCCESNSNSSTTSLSACTDVRNTFFWYLIVRNIILYAIGSLVCFTSRCFSYFTVGSEVNIFFNFNASTNGECSFSVCVFSSFVICFVTGTTVSIAFFSLFGIWG
jgi:hypothetical protein